MKLTTDKQRAAADLLQRFPDAPAQSLARRAMVEHPGLWANIDHARSSIRRLIGSQGGASKKDSTLTREKRAPGDWLEKIPPALSHFNDWKAVQFNGPAHVLILSDIHLPYHDPEAIGIALQYGLDHGADFVLLNGDVFDFFGLSSWEKDPRERDFPAEVRCGIEFLNLIRDTFPDARIVYKEGNHEERFDRYMRVNAPELLGVSAFTWPEIYHLDRLKIEHVGEKRPIRLGALNVIHGHEYRFSISNPVNPARGFFLRAKVNILGGHLHQTSHHAEKDLEGKVVSSWSTGCLCNLHPDYRPLNSWNLGAAFVEVSEDGAFRVENLRIMAGRAW